uniref:Uncharacterized protein n=1 Tax=Arcella intermedia TaxID=1963864 RepID=A0A6B2LV61_9EUKA
MKDIDQYDENVHKVLVGNKCDKEKRQVTTEEAQKFADQSKLEYFETSAKNATNVEELFSKMASSIKDKLDS